MKEKPSYYSIIPATVRYDEDLSPNEKLMYGEITSLSNQHGYCWAENRYFAKLYNVHKKTVSSWVSNLEKRGYVGIKLEYVRGTKQVAKRRLYPIDIPIHEKMDTPHHKKMDTPIREITEEELSTTRTNNTSVNNGRNSAKAKYDDVHLELAKLLYKRVKENIPRTREPNFDNWANDIRLMVEQDGLSELEIRNAINWSQSNKFWKTNVRSTGKLRAQYEELYAQATRDNVYFDKKPKSKKESRNSEMDFEELQRMLNGD